MKIRFGRKHETVYTTSSSNESFEYRNREDAADEYSHGTIKLVLYNLNVSKNYLPTLSLLRCNYISGSEKKSDTLITEKPNNHHKQSIIIKVSLTIIVLPFSDNLG